MPTDIEIFQKTFPGCTFEGMAFGGLRVHPQTGFDDYKHGRFTEIVGGPEMYRGVAMFAKDMGWPLITLKVQENHVNEKWLFACMAHAAEVGIEAVPEVRGSGTGCLKFFLWIVIFCCCDALAGWTLPIFDLNGDWIDAGGPAFALVATYLIMRFLVNPPLERRAMLNARKKGQIYRDALPPVYGDVQQTVRANEISEEYFRRD